MKTSSLGQVLRISRCGAPGHALNQLANKDQAIASIISSSFDLKLIYISRKSKLRHPETDIMKRLWN
jgi:hypothetical protein